MKRIATIIALVFALCEFAYGDPKDWYSPTGSEKVDSSATLMVPDESGKNMFIKFNIGEDGTIKPYAKKDKENLAKWNELDAYAMLTLAVLQQALIARNEVETMAEKLDTSVITDVKEEEGVIKWYKGLTGGAGKNGNATEAGSVTITKYKGDDKHIKLGSDEKTFSLNGYFADDKIYGVTSSGFEECQFNVDEKSVDMNTDGDAEIKGWKTASAAEGTLAQQLDGKSQTHNNCLVLARAANGVAEYISIGVLGGKDVIDDASIKSNSEDKIEVAGFKDAAQGGMPYTTASSIAWTDAGGKGSLLTGNLGVPKWIEKESTRGAFLATANNEEGLEWSYTASEDKYYGTSHNGGGLGWYTLPNVTTNYIEVDGLTLVEELKDSGTRKVVKLADAPGVADGRLYAARMDGVGGTLKWYPFIADIPTNFPTIVDNKSVNSNNTGAVQLYNWENLGNGVLCKNGDHPAITNVISKVTATNGVENIGGANDRVGLAGWTAPQCSTSLAAMLTSNAVDSATHRVLCRRETANGVEMHYASIGKLGGIGGGALKFIGNYDATAVVIGSGDTTNTVTFAALDDGESPSVKVKVEADGANGVILKLGAFYK